VCRPDAVLNYDLSSQIDDNGILRNDVEVQAPDGLSALRIRRDTQALTSGNLPLRSMSVCVLDQAPSPGKGRVLVTTAYELGPSGATFDPPATIIMAYDPGALPKGVTENSLVMASYSSDAGQWMDLKSQVAVNDATVAARGDHFSTYAVLGRPVVRDWRPLIVGSTLLEVLAAAGVLYYLRRRNAANIQPEETQT
jgi:hypothetical protein